MQTDESLPDRHVKHDAACDWFKTQPIGKVLDVPSGTGAVTKRLQRMGFDVCCADIDPDRSRVSVDVSEVDLNSDRLPHGDETFDYVACIDSLHRIAFIENAVSEFSRVLRRDGVLLITIPNYAAFIRRVMFLFLGSLGRGLSRPTFSQSVQGHSQPAAHFRQPLLLPQLDFILRQHGFTDITVHPQKKMLSSRVGYPFGATIRAIGWALPRSVRKDFCLSQSSSNEVLLGSDYLFITAKCQ